MVKYYTAIACLTLFLMGCATSINSPEYQAANSAIYKQQLSDNRTLTNKAGAKLYVLGLALWGGEDWAENDVKLMIEKIAAFYEGHTLVPFLFSNREIKYPDDYPSFDQNMIDQSIDFIRDHITSDDILLVALSSHGGDKALVYRIGNRRYEVFRDKQIKAIVEPFAEHQKVIVVSACYSGRLVGVLKDERSIIITAARKDRTSYGCAPTSEHSWFSFEFGKSFDQLVVSEKPFSVKEWYKLTYQNVIIRERSAEMKKSIPQFFMGDAVTINERSK